MSTIILAFALAAAPPQAPCPPQAPPVVKPGATPPVSHLDAQEAVPTEYQQALAESIKTGKPLLVGVRCNPPASADWIVVRVDEWDWERPTPFVVLSAGGNHVGDVLPRTATAYIRQRLGLSSLPRQLAVPQRAGKSC